MPFRRLVILVPALALPACATPKATSSEAELNGLKKQIAQLQSRTDRLSERVARLEDQRTLRVSLAEGRVSKPASAPADSLKKADAPASPSADADAVEVPKLTVVKLRPPASKAPALDTSIPVVAPDPAVLASAAPASQPPAVDPAVEKADYDRALEALRTGDVKGGTDALLAFAEAHPEHSLSDDALYFAGLGLMGLKDYEKAAQTFAEVVSRYPAGNTVADSLLKLADCQWHLSQHDDARALYARVVSRFPGTAAAREAQRQLSTLSP